MLSLAVIFLPFVFIFRIFVSFFSKKISYKLSQLFSQVLGHSADCFCSVSFFYAYSEDVSLLCIACLVCFFRVVLKQAVLTEVPVYLTRKTRHFPASKNRKRTITVTSKQVRLGNRFYIMESDHVQLLRRELLDRVHCTQISHGSGYAIRMRLT